MPLTDAQVERQLCLRKVRNPAGNEIIISVTCTGLSIHASAAAGLLEAIDQVNKVSVRGNVLLVHFKPGFSISRCKQNIVNCLRGKLSN